MKKTQKDNRTYLIALLLAMLTLAVYWRVFGNGFINYFDDNSYIVQNTDIQDGLTPRAIAWAFTTADNANWHPLTWISHMLDFELFGLDPKGHHAVNLILHVANVLLLFLVLLRLTKSRWKSAFVAALFAIHPLHVESVAWAAERKDVLSTLFWVLTMLAYVGYVERPSIKRYVLVITAFVLGLLSKPMLVTLPLMLLLLDYWPLGRLTFGAKTGNTWVGLLREKIPLFALSSASCVITYIAQQKGDAVGSLIEYPMGVRLANALVAYVEYIAKTVWPLKLAVFYPHPGSHIPMWQVAGAGILLLSISFLVMRTGRKRPYLAFGWLWYVVTLIPVIGLVQVGDQAMADRYTYIPLIGLFVVIAWGVPESMRVWECGSMRAKRTPIFPILSSIVIVVLSVLTWMQVGYWRDTTTLFRHALGVTKGNYTAHNHLGRALAEQGRDGDAIKEYRLSLAIVPKQTLTLNSLGAALVRQNRFDEAISEYEDSIRLTPDFAAAHMNLGAALAMKGNLDRAIHEYGEALRIEPDMAQARDNLKLATDARDEADLVVTACRADALKNPGSAVAHYNLGVALERRGKTDDTIQEYRKAIRLKPDYGTAHKNLAVRLFVDGLYAEAWEEVHLCRKYGGKPHPGFIQALSQKMPDPGE